MFMLTTNLWRLERHHVRVAPRLSPRSTASVGAKVLIGVRRVEALPGTRSPQRQRCPEGAAARHWEHQSKLVTQTP